ncbi:hypothetical protein [Flavobacterium aciduliphilum]|uniref:Uncharacterized protein n=1 Tax=Flavobacterium aciduliphilum TaxID=1101402 RepID=A0A328YTA9_9FLAO|nr:hypothetical protein [Flavobacterium aciduliphilum]RAR73777.1 hypothetical protein CLV55_10396 [Flavobacterium aciduliphilum]
MTKSRNTLNAFTLSELKSQISIKLGFPIVGKTDCLKLSTLLQKKNYGSISVSTLYRLFVNYKGIIPYQNTLDVLSQYLEYSCWANFVDTVEKKSPNRPSPEKIEITNNLLFHCIQYEATKPLTSYFESIEEMDYSFKAKVALEVYDSLLLTKKPELFFSNFSKNKFVKQFVLEDAFDPGFRIKNYDWAFKLYCNNTFDNSKENLQDYVFSQSVLFRHYVLSNNNKEALEIGKKIFIQKPVLSDDLDDIFIFPNIRYRAYKLWYLILINKSRMEIKNYIEELLEYCRTIYIDLDEISRKIVFQTIGEVFCYTTIISKYHVELKTIFKKEFETIPNSVFEKPLKKTLHYFESNGLLFHRPTKS